MSQRSGLQRMVRTGISLLLLFGAACAPAAEPHGETQEEEWIQLFNGRDLTGWTLKLAGFEIGEDPFETVQVDQGILTVSYENYEEFGDHFGHLFYEEPFSDYQLRVEYRFVGEQVPGAPGWAFKNNGVMFHSQSPESMLLDQNFPLSIEAQLLGGNGVDDRPTANVCTPGTEIEINGALAEAHCISAEAPTIHGEEWVTMDIFVHGGSHVVHVMDGDTVLAYANLTVGGGSVEEFGEGAADEGRPLDGGYIALQCESHPTQFRKVMLRRLSPSGR